jgi:3-hydroxybutyryl-CoA dehydrogenase
MDAGVEVDGVNGGGPGHFIFGGLHLMPTDGRTATELAAEQVLGTNNVAVFDLVLDWDHVGHVGIAVADQADAGQLERAASLFQAIGCEVSRLDDSYALVVMRTIAQLAAVAIDAVAEGIAAPGDIDTAMCLGTSFPLGPLEWADRLGLPQIVRVLNNLHRGFGEDRYRVPPLLSRRAATGRSLRDDHG